MEILIAEDERISRRTLQRQLEQWGHKVTAVENGREAWEMFQEREFSIVVSDWMMPEMDGPELVRQIRGFEAERYIYVILLTSKSEKSDIVAGMEAGADDFLSKPFDRNELHVRLRAGERIIELERNLAQRNLLLHQANERMKHDLEAAAKVQQALLPTVLPQTPRADFAWNFTPCDELAGDFFNVFSLDEQHVGMYVADVSGHGVASSLLSVMISRVLTAQPSALSLLVRRDNGDDKIRIVPPAEVAGELTPVFVRRIVAIERVAEACSAKGMPMGIDCLSAEHITRCGALGYRCFTFEADFVYLEEGARAAVAAARTAAP